MTTAETERARVTPLELFFDLVFVFAITQVTILLKHDPTWGGVLRAVLLLSILWWAWSAYAWLTNTLDPDEGGVRLAMLAAMAAMLIASLAVPHAFGRDGVTFAVAYAIVRAFHLILFAQAGRGDHDLLRAVLRIVPNAAVASTLLLVAAFLDGPAQLAVWTAAVVADYGAGLVGHLQGWHISPDHFVERFGQIILIALGESIVALGVGAQGVALDADVITAALLGFCVIACVWWSYFDWSAYVVSSQLSDASGTRRSALARDVYSYLHLPMVAGIVFFAFGLSTALHNPRDELGTVPAFGLAGGIALYFVAHVLLRLRIGGGWGRGRPAAAVLLLALVPVTMAVPALIALALVAAVCVALITYEVLRHRDSRALIRARHGAVTSEEMARLRADGRG